MSAIGGTMTLTTYEEIKQLRKARQEIDRRMAELKKQYKRECEENEMPVGKRYYTEDTLQAFRLPILRKIAFHWWNIAPAKLSARELIDAILQAQLRAGDNE